MAQRPAELKRSEPLGRDLLEEVHHGPAVRGVGGGGIATVPD